MPMRRQRGSLWTRGPGGTANGAYRPPCFRPTGSESGVIPSVAQKMGWSARQGSPYESYKRLHPEGRVGLHPGASGEENNVLVPLEELTLPERLQGGPGRCALGARIQTELAGHLDLAGPHMVVAHRERRSAPLPHRPSD